MSNTWNDTVGRITDGVSTFSANNLNPIFSALENRTNFLKNKLDNLVGSYGLIYTDTGFDASVIASGKGTILAWDSSVGKYIPAAAAFSSIVRTDGSLAPAESSYVVGVLVSNISNDGFGTILSSGWTSDPALIAELTNDGVPGPYYLSEGGKAVVGTSEQFSVPVYCFTYLNTGKLVFNPRCPEYTGHSHDAHDLPVSGWERLNNESEAPEAIQGSGTIYSVYRSENDPTLARILSTNPTKAVLTKNGTLIDDGDWCIYDGDVYTAFEILDVDSITLYTISPLQGKEPLVHSLSVAYGNSLLSVDTTSGNVVIDTNFTPASEYSYPGYAVAAINKTGVVRCPVVHNLSAGPGTVMTTARDENGNIINGSYIISTAAVLANQADLQVCNLDGVLFGTESDRVSYVFPSGVTSSLYGNFRIPHYDNGTFSATLTLLVRGNGGSIPQSSALITTMPFSTADAGSVVLPGIEVTIPGKSNTLAQRYYTIQTTIPASYISSDALLNMKLTFSEPSISVNVLSVSLKLSAE